MNFGICKYLGLKYGSHTNHLMSLSLTFLIRNMHVKILPRVCMKLKWNNICKVPGN